MKIVIRDIKEMPPEMASKIATEKNGITVSYIGSNIDLVITDPDLVKTILQILEEKLEIYLPSK